MSNATTTDVKGAMAPVHSPKHGCCGGEAAPKPRTDASGVAGQCGGHSEPHAHETPSEAGSCCCGGAASGSPPAGPKGPSVKSK